MHVDEMSGVALVQRDGVTVAERVGGKADRDLGLACTRATRFQIASVSKQFTAAAVLLLATRSQLSLGDRIGRWFTGCPQHWQAITIHHLLTHTSGLGHWDDFPALDQHRPLEPARELDIFQQEPLLSAPGSRYRYSSPGYVLLAWIVEKASSQPYAAYLAGQLFGPLGLRTASAGNPPGGAGMARGYHASAPVPSIELATVNIGAGDIWCTADDLLRWDQAVAHGELLPAPTREAMLTMHTPPEPAASHGFWSVTGYGYGYGWQIGAIDGLRAYFHTGDNPGYLAINAWFPDEHITLAILTNDQATDLAQAVTDMLELAT